MRPEPQHSLSRHGCFGEPIFNGFQRFIGQRRELVALMEHLLQRGLPRSAAKTAQDIFQHEFPLSTSRRSQIRGASEGMAEDVDRGRWRVRREAKRIRWAGVSSYRVSRPGASGPPAAPQRHVRRWKFRYEPAK